jgi:D-3-phosphoglycerate dehydrogenase / 2-oxoglutarate reductase
LLLEDFTKPGRYAIQTFNKISRKGLSQFPDALYTVEPREAAADGKQQRIAQALLLRSHKLKEEEVDVAVRAIARCGAGTNNIPVQRMTELGT